MSLEAENELRHFLKVAKPEWSAPRRRGKSNINKVMDKLRDVGVTDTETLIDGIESTKLNEQLFASNHVQFSREAIERIRKQSPFARTLESVDIPHIRQIGHFASAPQMLSRKRLVSHFALRSPKATPPTRSAASSRAGTAGTMGERAKSDSGLLAEVEGFDVDPSLYGVAGEPFTLRLKYAQPKGGKKSRAPPVSVSLEDPFRKEYANSLQQRSCKADGGEDSEDGASLKSSSPLRSSRSVAGKSIAISSVGVDTDTIIAADNASGAVSRSKNANISQRTTKASSGGYADSQGGFRSTKSAPNDDGGQRQLTMEEVAKLLKAGHDMGLEQRESMWSSASVKSLQQQGEEMLMEQEALDERDRLKRTVSGTYTYSMRQHVTKNIRSRLREEPTKEDVKMSIQQKCINIRKHLASMVNSRRELAGLRQKVSTLAEDEEPQAAPEILAGLSLGFGK